MKTNHALCGITSSIGTTAIAALSAAALLLGSPNAQAGLIVNGSFEQPVLSAGEYRDVAGGDSTTITGWTVLGNDVGLVQNAFSEPGNGMTQFNAQAGLNSLDLTGSANSGPTDGIQQTVATTPGQQYALSFYVGRAQSSNGSSIYQGPATIRLSINGGSAVSFTNTDTPTPGFMDWQNFNTIFTAATSSTTIAFLNGTPTGTNEAGLDNVSVVGVPEPGTALFGFVCVGVAALRRRRRA